LSRVQTYLWVLNEEDEYARALYYGASGIMTDFPSRLSQYLDLRNHYSEHWTVLSSWLQCWRILWFTRLCF